MSSVVSDKSVSLLLRCCVLSDSGVLTVVLTVDEMLGYDYLIRR